MDKVLIIGSNSGVGKVLAEQLANSHELYTASRNPPGDGHGRHVVWDALKNPFPQVFLPERLDGLDYCPGSIRLQPFDRLSEGDFRVDFELNLLGAVRALRASMPALKAPLMASVVMFTTVAATTGMPMHASIAAAKGAVEGLTRSLTAELAPQIRVNAIAPSLTDTPLAATILRSDRYADSTRDDVCESYSHILKQRHWQSRSQKMRELNN